MEIECPMLFTKAIRNARHTLFQNVAMLFPTSCFSRLRHVYPSKLRVWCFLEKNQWADTWLMLQEHLRKTRLSYVGVCMSAQCYFTGDTLVHFRHTTSIDVSPIDVCWAEDQCMQQIHVQEDENLVPVSPSPYHIFPAKGGGTRWKYSLGSWEINKNKARKCRLNHYLFPQLLFQEKAAYIHENIGLRRNNMTTVLPYVQMRRIRI